MIRLILTVALCVLTAILAVWLTLNPGTASFEFLGWQAETSFALFMGVLIVTAFLLAVLWWLIAKVWGAPDAWRKLRQRRRREQGVDALERALIAAAAGEGELAVRQAARADALLERPALSRLLAARAAEAAGNLLAARGHYEALLEDPKTRLVAHRGLSVLAETQGETGNVITHAGKAYAEARNARWAFDSLFNAQIAAARWDEALETLTEGEKRRHLPPDNAGRRRAVILTVQARQLRQSDAEKATNLAERAASASPGFAPAAVLAGELLPGRRRHRKAADILESAWRLRPHPAIARAYGDLRKSDTPAKRAARLRTLAELNPDHRESRLLLAGIALQQRNMEAARAALTPLLSENPLSARVCALAARLSRLEGDEDAAQRFLARATHAPGEADWSDIDADGEAFNFAESDWQRLVYAWGDEDRLIHPRHERFEMIAEALPDRILLEAPRKAAPQAAAKDPAATETDAVIIAPAPLPDRETRRREEIPASGPRFAPDDPGVSDDEDNR
ncbi:MAG: heme biosynthesis protein HemY [Caulobacterales bacterium]|uniref:heme biosynthesis protein HemY n=1 Tax=Glycocaulis sp. TaxID=1969725 RepID=UPI003FA15904